MKGSNSDKNRKTGSEFGARTPRAGQKSHSRQSSPTGKKLVSILWGQAWQIMGP